MDTDTWIEYFHDRSGIGIHIKQTPNDEVFASEVSMAELTYGALHSNNVEKHMKEPKIIQDNFRVLQIPADWHNYYADIRQRL